MTDEVGGNWPPPMDRGGGDSGPDVSIIIPTNRMSPYLGAALQSVVVQSWEQWEIVIVDDGVPDPGMLEALAARTPRCRVVRHAPGGVSMARNRGLAESHGSLVAFLDDDDLWHPDFLRLQIEAMRGDPSARGSYCSGWLIDAHGDTLSTAWAPVGASVRQLLRGEVDLPSLRTMLLGKSDGIAVGGFNPGLRYAEDLEFVFRMLGSFSFTSIPDKLVAYRRYPESEIAKADLLAVQASSRRAVELQIWSAQERGDSATAHLLEANLHRVNASAAQAALRRAAMQIRQGDLRLGVATAVTAVKQAPRSVLKSAASTAATKVRHTGVAEDGDAPD